MKRLYNGSEVIYIFFQKYFTILPNTFYLGILYTSTYCAYNYNTSLKTVMTLVCATKGVIN